MPRKKKTTEQYIAEVKEIHKGTYSYDKTIYHGALTKIVITCRNHGDFHQLAGAHRQGQGCSKCAYDEKRSTPDKNLKDLKKVHPSYSFPEIENGKIVTHNQKIIFICPKHGEKNATINNLLNGRGCKKCQYENQSIRQTKPQNQFIKECKLVHGDEYDYSKSIYQGGKKYVDVICKTHGEFKVIPINHINKGAGCPDCALTGFSRKSPAMIYYLRVKGTDIYKIGITGRPFKKRFKGDLSRIELILCKRFEVGEDARKLEQYILKRYKKYKYNGHPLLIQAGTAEMFSCDIFNL